MKAIFATLFVVLMLSSDAFAQKYVIELEGYVFDRELTEAEHKLIEDKTKDLPGQERAGVRVHETIALLRNSGRELDHFKSSILATLGEPVSMQLDAKNMRLEANLAIIERKDDAVTLDCQLASGYVREQLSHIHRIASQRTIKLDQTDQIGGGGAESRDSKGKLTAAVHQILLLYVREATEDDLELKKVSESFDTKLQRKIKGGTLPGGKLGLK